MIVGAILSFSIVGILNLLVAFRSFRGTSNYVSMTFLKHALFLVTLLSATSFDGL